jgi:Concanavalin A-like lectin/glucanases superfamily
VVFTRQQSTGRIALFVDGGGTMSTTATTNALTASTTLAFGCQNAGSNWFAGALDEVALYTAVLPDTTIAGHYAAR